MEKKELVKILKENFYDKDTNTIYLTGLNFGDVNVKLIGAVVGGSLDLEEIIIGKDLNCYNSKIFGNVYDHNRKIFGQLYNDDQIVYNRTVFERDKFLKRLNIKGILD